MEFELDERMGQLQSTFALGSPIVVIGPGCHRIGYDSTDSWQKVNARARALYATLDADSDQQFLEHYWESKLSDETRQQIEGDNLGANAIDELNAAAMEIAGAEPARVKLAGSLLRGLVECTSLLGKVIATGEAPVWNWLGVSYGRSGKDFPDDAETDLEAAAQAVNDAKDLAVALDRVHHG